MSLALSRKQASKLARRGAKARAAHGCHVCAVRHPSRGSLMEAARANGTLDPSSTLDPNDPLETLVARKRRREASATALARANAARSSTASDAARDEENAPRDAIRRIRGVVAYNGARFHGFQRAANNGWIMPTVQTALETALSRAYDLLKPQETLVGYHCKTPSEVFDTIGPNNGLPPPVVVTGASRTDTGVNAAGQVFHFEAPASADPDGDLSPILARCNEELNAQGIQMLRLEPVPKGEYFDSSRSSVGKRYCYTVYDGRDDPVAAEQVHHRFSCLYTEGYRKHHQDKLIRLDSDAMDRAAAAIASQTRNFRLFTRSTNRGGRSNLERKLHRARVLRTRSLEPMVVDFDTRHDPAGDFVHFVVEGSGFLYLMVRCLATALIKVGKSEVTVEQLLEQGFSPPDEEEVIRQRLHYSPAPPEGLTLAALFYAQPGVFGDTMHRPEV